jgi:hypothetical protein
MNPANYPADLADRLFAFETGELDEKETLQFFADLELARIGSDDGPEWKADTG